MGSEFHSSDGVKPLVQHRSDGVLLEVPKNDMGSSGEPDTPAPALSPLEQASLIRSVTWLGRHVPVCVLNRLGQEIRIEEDEEEHSIHHELSSEGHLSDLSDEDGEEFGPEDLDFVTSPERGVLGALHEEENEEASREAEQDIQKSQVTHGNLSVLVDFPNDGGNRQEESERMDSWSSLECDNEEAPKLQKSDGRLVHEKWGSSPKRRLSMKLEPLRLPYASKHDCALLYVDISGFTRLSKLLSPERLSEVINSYFHVIMDEVTSLGGDILKFAGDALFAEWQATSDPSHVSNVEDIPPSVDPVNRMSLADCVASAAACGAMIVSKFSDYPVFADNGNGTNGIGWSAKVATLNVHCGLGVGMVVGVHVGDNRSRREYLVLGEPIKQSTEAANMAALGEFFASSEALAVLSRKCRLDDPLASHKGKEAVLIASKSSLRFSLWDPKQQRRCSVTHLWEDWDTESMRRYRELISLYVHPVVVNSDLAAHKMPRRIHSVQGRHSEEAELRSVYVMFVHMNRLRAEVTGDMKHDTKLFRLLNDIMELTTRELNRFSGHLRQFIVDDKGLVLIATFGLRGSTFPNMVTERALPATTIIHNALQSELGVHNRIGATLGDAYCGLIGGMKRHEFAVLGPAVNLAARLMTNKSNPGILVDDAIRLKAGKSYGFNALDPVEAKGFAAPVPIFVPLTSLERGWGKIKTSFVGRKKEIKKLADMSREMSSTRNAQAKMVFVTAKSGTGKSNMVIHAVEYIRRVLTRKRKRVLIAKHVCKDSDRLVPFSMLRTILPDVLDEVQTWEDDNSVMSNSKTSVVSGMTWASANDSEIDFQWEALSVGSSVSGGSASHSSPDRLLRLFRDMDAPPEFMELVAHHLLGIEMSGATTGEPHDAAKRKAPSLQRTVNFMAQAFQKCTQRANLVVIALDDVHNLDEMSWKVLYKFFVTSRNLLIICTSQPLSSYKLTMDDMFWKELNGKYSKQRRFVTMQLDSLEEIDIRKFLAIELGVEEDEIGERFLRYVFTQTGGMPHLVTDLVRDLRKRRIIGMGADNVYGWQDDSFKKNELAAASVGELIVHRVDSFDQTVRDVLNLGAVLGDSFELLELIPVLQQLDGASRSQEIPRIQDVSASLDVLVEEGILRQIFEGGEDDSTLQDAVSTVPSSSSSSTPRHGNGIIGLMEKAENRLYTFCHDLWRSSILQLMLDSRKKDMHRTIALVLEEQNVDDYESRVKLLSHWKASGNFSKAAVVSLELGRSYGDLGLHHQGIRLYEETLQMWNNTKQPGEMVGGLSSEAVDSMSAQDIEFSVRLYTAMASCLADTHKATESVLAFQSALEIFETAPATAEIKDRSLCFPIFSGLFVALKCGTIKQDEDCAYEQDLIRRFVYETRLNQEPVHYCRALAMQGEFHGRHGNFEKAFESHDELTKVYVPDEHSTEICKAYGSDWAAQSFSACSLWYMEQGDMEKALQKSLYVIKELMPKMESCNLYNSCTLLYPTLWVMKANGLALEARETFAQHVMDPFNEHYGEETFTSWLPVFDPIMMLLDLAVNQGAEVDKFDEYLTWALNQDNLRFGTVMNKSTGILGRCADSISAEICLLLAKQLKGGEHKAVMARNGLTVARDCLELTDRKTMVVALRQTEHVLSELEVLAGEVDGFEK